MLGYIVGKKTVQPVAKQLDVIAKWEILLSIRDAQSIYGFLFYFLPYLLNFMQKAAYISILLCEGTQFVQTAKHTATVKAIFYEVRKHEGFHVPRSDMPFALVVNVKNYGFGGILLQDCYSIACK